MNYKDFKSLPKEYQEHYIKEILPIINVINKNMLSINEVYVMLEILTPIIAHRCLLGDRLKDFLDQRLGRYYREQYLNINDYK